ncbi:MAG TPA: transcriptional repressor, partial [Firmicutes bacterium]|nr:transcriptional repressor [Bacillota bacterium]
MYYEIKRIPFYELDLEYKPIECYSLRDKNACMCHFNREAPAGGLLPGVGEMEASVEDFRARLREKGYKLTFQRLTIFEALQQGPRHPTAEELHRYVARKFPMIGLSTVYNTLETLCQLGELSKVAIGPNVTRYDVDPQPHVHLVCLKCGRIFDMPDLKCEPCRLAVERKV